MKKNVSGRSRFLTHNSIDSLRMLLYNNCLFFNAISCTFQWR